MNISMDQSVDPDPLSKEYLAGLIGGIVVVVVCLWLGIDFFLFHREQSRKKERKNYLYYRWGDKGRVTGLSAIKSDAKPEEEKVSKPKEKKNSKMTRLLTFLKIRKNNGDDKEPKKKFRRSQSVGLPPAKADDDKRDNDLPQTESNTAKNGNSNIDADSTGDVLDNTKSNHAITLLRKNVVGPLDVQKDKRYTLPPIQLDIINEAQKNKDHDTVSFKSRDAQSVCPENGNENVHSADIIKNIYSKLPREQMVPGLKPNSSSVHMDMEEYDVTDSKDSKSKVRDKKNVSKRDSSQSITSCGSTHALIE